MSYRELSLVDDEMHTVLLCAVDCRCQIGGDGRDGGVAVPSVPQGCEVVGLRRVHGLGYLMPSQ